KPLLKRPIFCQLVLFKGRPRRRDGIVGTRRALKIEIDNLGIELAAGHALVDFLVIDDAPTTIDAFLRFRTPDMAVNVGGTRSDMDGGRAVNALRFQRAAVDPFLAACAFECAIADRFPT